MSFNAQLNPLKKFLEKDVFGKNSTNYWEQKYIKAASKKILFYNAVFQWGCDRIAGIATAKQDGLQTEYQWGQDFLHLSRLVSLLYSGYQVIPREETAALGRLQSQLLHSNWCSLYSNTILDKFHIKWLFFAMKPSLVILTHYGKHFFFRITSKWRVRSC